MFFDQTTTALQNRDEEKEIRRNAYINELNQYMAENQELENVINSQQQYKTNVPIKNRKGQIIGYKSALPYEPTTGFFGRGFRYNPNINAQIPAVMKVKSEVYLYIFSLPPTCNMPTNKQNRTTLIIR